MSRIFVFLGACLTLSCGKGTPPPAENAGAQTTKQAESSPSSGAPEAILIKLSSPNLLFRYFKDGTMHIATSVEKVPQDKRHEVYIDNLDISPTARNSVLYLQRYDLSVLEEDKAYVGTPVLRADVERLIQKARPKPTVKKAPAGPDAKALKTAKVVLYSTSWCGYCRKARKFLQTRKIPFQEKDIEKSPAANKEMKTKAAKAGVRVGGVPVLDVNGKIIPGFDRNAILQALDG